MIRKFLFSFLILLFFLSACTRFSNKISSGQIENEGSNNENIDKTPENSEKKSLIWDDDGSPDGIISLLYFLNHPKVDVLAATISYGEAHPKEFAYDVAAMLDYVGHPEIPVAGGNDEPLDGENVFPDFLREPTEDFWGISLPTSDIKPLDISAAELIIKTIKESDGPITLFVSGSYTNIAEAIRIDPSIINKIQSIESMGGAIYDNGNVSSNNRGAEWNIFVDPVAAHEVFSKGIDINLTPLDATNQAYTSREELSKLLQINTPSSVLAADILEWKFDFQNSDKFTIFDLLAAINTTDPEICDWEELPLNVNLEPGNKQGETYIDESSSTKINVCLMPDENEVNNIFLESFLNASKTSKNNAFAEIYITDFEGNEVVFQDDNLKANIVSDPTGSNGYRFKWYRNGILLEGAEDYILENDTMKNYHGNQEEYTPASKHTEHSIRGFDYKVEVFNENNEKIGASSITVYGPEAELEMRGINFTAWSSHLIENGLGKASLQTLINRINPNWVSIWNQYFQDSMDATEIYPIENGDLITLSDEEIMDLINTAHNLGLKVILYPSVWLKGEYYQIPKNLTSPDEWFESYKEFILHQADIAQKMGVEVLVIGVKLKGSEQYSKQWEEIIGLVRQHYDGKITYSFSWEGGNQIEQLQYLQWVSELDYIGLSFDSIIFPDLDTDVSLSEIEESLVDVEQGLRTLSEKLEKKIIILENKIDSFDGVLSRDRQENIFYINPDHQEQADYYDAFLSVFSTKKYIDGLILNEWQSNSENFYNKLDIDGVDWSRSGEIIGKLAERVVSSWYGGKIQ